ncbi:ABC transporter ATP-binding protein [Falsigemmobacter faecalis]|uniref:ABC transporter ATP-binding protein n=1 Tax=Falsigemmobacter faecalis TaxID=2488730 RepID=A0A3P3DGK1_9RHOB|nr:ABC transporter ATP-binding protein [Falsigemmobacter faecalis]RRH72796.1 ABC transporter ATP-binding protein [Falsigemmobacter faecalis]
MLEIRGLTLRAGGRVLLQDLSLQVPGQGITALLGASGCGKSSVLKWLAGILPEGVQAEGEVLVDGQPRPTGDRLLAYQPQNDALFPWLTIAENAALGLRMAGVSAKLATARVLPLFAPFGLAGTEGLYPEDLSGGMRQRAAFLRTMVQERPFVLLDEPFSALDAVTRLKMQTWLLARLSATPRGGLLVTHDLQEAAALADRICVITAGHGVTLPVDMPHSERTEAAMAPLRETLKSLLLEECPP